MEVVGYAEVWIGRTLFVPLGHEVGIELAAEGDAGPSSNQEVIFEAIEHRWHELTQGLSHELMVILREWLPNSMNAGEGEGPDADRVWENARLQGLRINHADAQDTWQFQLFFGMETEDPAEQSQVAGHMIVVYYVDWKIARVTVAD